jgi:uncharacterized membrane protein
VACGLGQGFGASGAIREFTALPAITTFIFFFFFFIIIIITTIIIFLATLNVNELLRLVGGWSATVHSTPSA